MGSTFNGAIAKYLHVTAVKLSQRGTSSPWNVGNVRDNTSQLLRKVHTTFKRIYSFKICNFCFEKSDKIKSEGKSMRGNVGKIGKFIFPFPDTRNI